MGKHIKINNSEPCLCGSGQKFKDCCKTKIFKTTYGYSEDILSNPHRINAILQERLDKTDFKICMYPDKSCCKLPIKNAHTLQNNGVLSTIYNSRALRRPFYYFIKGQKPNHWIYLIDDIPHSWYDE